MNGFTELLTEAMTPRAPNSLALFCHDLSPHMPATIANWKGSQQTMKHDVTAIIVVMTFLCDLFVGFERLPAAEAAAAAAVEVDGPAVCCCLELTRIERVALPALTVPTLLPRSTDIIFQ